MCHFVINNMHVLIAYQCPLHWTHPPTQARYTERGVYRGRGLFCNTELLFFGLCVEERKEENAYSDTSKKLTVWCDLLL